MTGGRQANQPYHIRTHVEKPRENEHKADAKDKERLLKEAENLWKKGKQEDAILIHGIIGEHEKAIQKLEKAIQDYTNQHDLINKGKIQRILNDYKKKHDIQH